MVTAGPLYGLLGYGLLGYGLLGYGLPLLLSDLISRENVSGRFSAASYWVIHSAEPTKWCVPVPPHVPHLLGDGWD